MRTLYDRLNEYNQSDYYGFHMPGHKRNATICEAGLPYGIDITEIDGFDDLHHADGILKEAQERAARVYGSEETKFLVNGSTVGILSAILGSTKRGDHILVARHCHKSIYHAIYLNELKPVYLYPEFDEEIHLNTEISVSTVKAALENDPDIKAVMIVSPTYDGVISDVEGIAKVVHEKKIPLIVDEAHGAHFGFHPYFGENSLKKGADVVIHSVHKTLPSLTQTALFHVQGEIVNRRRIYRYLDMLQSSSPSYVLMASIDNCIRMLDEECEELFVPYVARLQKVREELQKLNNLQLLETEHFDPSKIVIGVQKVDMSGHELSEVLLRDYHLQMEMAAGTYVIAMTSVADTDEGMDRLVNALMDIDRKIDVKSAANGENKPFLKCEKDVTLGSLPENEQVYTIAEALELVDTFSVAEQEKDLDKQFVTWQQAIGHVAGEYTYLYPPGSPIIVPGERISKEAVLLLEKYEKLGFSIEGIRQEGKIRIVK